MKIYIDKMPKSCESCDIHKLNLYCLLSNLETDSLKYEKHIKCPLKSLHYHDNQLKIDERKKTCEMFRKRLFKN